MYSSHLFDLLFSGNKRNLMVPHMLFEKKQNKGHKTDCLAIPN